MGAIEINFMVCLHFKSALHKYLFLFSGIEIEDICEDIGEDNFFPQFPLDSENANVLEEIQSDYKTLGKQACAICNVQIVIACLKSLDKVKKNKKIAWIRSHHLYFQRKLKSWAIPSNILPFLSII